VTAVEKWRVGKKAKEEQWKGLSGTKYTHNGDASRNPFEYQLRN
jgi:hypothetical protein